ncbi:MAG: hypothetical protein NWS67_01880, partial [Schleiferiaceae bacterium]|nr:hypothetical protein [Schleiferiaceae bacterium]MDP4626873.1 hypothetical protein [Schleiferiaceae bacterium]
MRKGRVVVFVVLLGLVLGAFPAWSQKVLQPSDFDGWERITVSELSPDGRYAAAVVSPQVGDSRVVFYAASTGQKWSLTRADWVRFDALSQRALVRIPAPAAKIR